MGTVKDLVDLVTQLNGSVTDRKFAGELREIQSMIAALQSEHAEIHEKRIQLLEVNANLRQEIVGLKEEINLLKQPKIGKNNFNPNVKLIEEEERILVYLTHVERVTAGDVSRLLNCNGAKAGFWLSKLRDQELIGFSIIMDGPTKYNLKQCGREYLIAHGHM